MVSRIYKKISNLKSKKYFELVKQRLSYAGINIDARKWIGFFILYPIFLGLTAMIFLYLIYNVENPLLYLLTFIIVTAFFHFTKNIVLSLLKNKRASFVEKILPDVLSLISNNIRSGMTVDQAILNASRPEF